MKKTLLMGFAFGTLASLFATDVPEIAITSCTQDSSSRNVTIGYTLTKGPAIVTLEIYTNCTADSVGAPIEGKRVRSLLGEVNKVVANGSHTIVWNARADWPDQRISSKSVKAKLTAWMLDMPPDIMVVDLVLASGATEYECRYYPSIESLPGGLLENSEYRETKLVMKKVKAPQDGKAQLGALGEYKLDISKGEYLRRVSLSNDYYLAVFELTQRQYKQVMGSYPSTGFVLSRDRRPVEKKSYNDLRGGTAYDYPLRPASATLLGTLDSKTGYAFDFPSETQWEYAARSGVGDGRNCDGSTILATTDDLNKVEDANLSRLARYYENVGYDQEGVDSEPDVGGTAEVGTYLPNLWGFYDMQGDVQEFCIDFYKADISATDGAVVTPSAADNSANCVLRGGSWWDHPAGLRLSRRGATVARTVQNKSCGVRPCCPTVMK